MKRIFVLLLFVLVSEGLVTAQPLKGVHRIGVLTTGSDLPPNFLRSLREMGYVDGQNIIIEHRSGTKDLNLLPKLAADLVSLKVAAIVAVGPTAIARAVNATRTIPIIMVDGGDPVSRGFVESLSRPGANVTGLSSFAPGQYHKRMELLKETLPSVFRVTMLNARIRKAYIENYRSAAVEIGVELESVDALATEQFSEAFAKIAARRPNALITARDVLIIRHTKQIVEFTYKTRLAWMSDAEQFVQAGGLISYGVNYKTSGPRAAVYVDKVLRGANPTTLPIEPPKFELVINLKTARKLGITIPPEILLEANEVIK